MTRQEILTEIDRLQVVYEKKMAVHQRDTMVPPPIKQDALNGIVKQMDKLDTMLNNLED